MKGGPKRCIASPFSIHIEVKLFDASELISSRSRSNRWRRWDAERRHECRCRLPNLSFYPFLVYRFFLFARKRPEDVTRKLGCQNDSGAGKIEVFFRPIYLLLLLFEAWTLNRSLLVKNHDNGRGRRTKLLTTLESWIGCWLTGFAMVRPDRG